MKQPKPETAPIKGLDFWEAHGFDEPNALVASVRIEGGKLVWTVGPEVGPGLLEDIRTEADPNLDPAGFLIEVWRYIRSSYLWAVKVH